MAGDPKKIYKLLGISQMTEGEFVNVCKMPAAKRKPFLQDLAKKEGAKVKFDALEKALKDAGLS